MKKENDELTDLFRSRLTEAELPVRETCWEKLEKDLPVAVRHRKLMIYRFSAAASVLLVLMAASAAFWYFSPKEEIANAFVQAERTAGANATLEDDAVKEDFPSIHPATVLSKSSGSGDLPSSSTNLSENASDSVSVTVSMYFSFSSSSSYTSRNRNKRQQQTAMVSEQAVSDRTEAQSVNNSNDNSSESTKKATTALKIGASIAPISAKGLRAPIGASVTLEKKLSKRFSVEAGINYSCEQSVDEGNLHYIGVPVKANLLIATNDKLDVYASIGGIADKCIGGAPRNGFGSEPIQLAMTAGLGVNYKLNDKFAVFAEPTLVRHFDADRQWETARSRKSTNLNLLCGVRMTY